MDCVYYNPGEGRFLRPSTAEDAFCLATSLNAEEHPSEFRAWTKQANIVRCELSEGLVRKCLKNRQRLIAFKVYCEIHRCHFPESIDEIRKIQERMKGEGYDV